MSSTLILRPPLSLARRWPLAVCALLLPIWCIGTLYRGAWTPDEPREADIVWHMAHQDDRVLPNFAGKPFLEKPPLSYCAWADRAVTSRPSATAKTAMADRIVEIVRIFSPLGRYNTARSSGRRQINVKVQTSRQFTYCRMERGLVVGVESVPLNSGVRTTSSHPPLILQQDPEHGLIRLECQDNFGPVPLPVLSPSAPRTVKEEAG